jgi:hypothetical protein
MVLLAVTLAELIALKPSTAKVVKFGAVFNGENIESVSGAALAFVATELESIWVKTTGAVNRQVTVEPPEMTFAVELKAATSVLTFTDSLLDSNTCH